jgi:CubicO group peptidase (beta-lactamase class C family)
MRRRGFLRASSQAALITGFAPSEVWPQTSQLPDKARRGSQWKTLTADLEKLIPALMTEAIVPGLSIALVQNGKLLWRKAFGVKDSASNEPVDDDTVFEAASVSKTVFAYAVMKLCEKSALDLDASLTHYAAKPFLEGDARLKLITTRRVLSHTTGFQDFRSRREPLKIHFTPGEKYLYSGEGYCYLQSVVSHLTGQENPQQCGKYEGGLEVCATDIDAYLKRNLLQPFGMHASGYVWNDSFAKHAARPHDVMGKPLTKSKPTAADAARYAAVGGLHTSPSDYAKFLIEVVAPKPSDAFRLTKKTLQEMLRPQIKLAEGEKVDGADAWALGWGIQQRKTGDAFVHSGGQAGFRSLAMASVQRKSGYIILTNSDNGGNVINHQALVERLNPLLTA